MKVRFEVDINYLGNSPGVFEKWVVDAQDFMRVRHLFYENILEFSDLSARDVLDNISIKTSAELVE